MNFSTNEKKRQLGVANTFRIFLGTRGNGDHLSSEIFMAFYHANTQPSKEMIYCYVLKVQEFEDIRYGIEVDTNLFKLEEIYKYLRTHWATFANPSEPLSRERIQSFLDIVKIQMQLNAYRYALLHRN